MNGEKLKSMRIAKGLSQKDVAKLLGIDRTTYLKYENGSSNPNLARLMQLANYFDTTPDNLLSKTTTIHKDSQIAIGETLKQLRKERGLTQAEVADALHLNRSTYTKYETGSNAPSVEQIKALSKIFRVTADDILNPQTQENAKTLITVKPTIRNDSEKLLGLYHSLDDQSKNQLMSVAYLLAGNNLARECVDISQLIEQQLNKINNKRSKEKTV